MPKPRDILLALGYYDPRFHAGVARYAREHGWHLMADMAYGRRIPWGWRGDGIVSKVTGDDALARFVTSAAVSGVPVVNVGRGTKTAMPLVLIDEKGVVDLALDHLISRGFEHFAWFGPSPARLGREFPFPDLPNRPEMFIRRIEKRKMSCAVLDRAPAHGPSGWPDRRAWLIDRLRAMPRPAAVFCWDDAEAAHVIHACRIANLATPEEVAVLGVNNDDLICEALPVPLSTIDTDMEGRAYAAAALLDKRMAGRRVPARTLIPPKCIVTRKSTDFLAIANPEVARAVRFIWENAHTAMSIVDTANAVKLSPRGLHKAFVRHLGRSPGEELQRIRLERAKRLIRETSDKLASIARAAGYGSPKAMFRAFRNSVGTTPRQYRLSLQKAAKDMPIQSIMGLNT